MKGVKDLTLKSLEESKKHIDATSIYEKFSLNIIYDEANEINMAYRSAFGFNPLGIKGIIK